MASNIKVGDRVRYLNAVGGGVVRSFKGKNIVLVEEEDGFETPILASEVVVVQATNQYNFPVETSAKDVTATVTQKAAQETRQEEDEPEVKVPEYTWNERYETKEGERLSAYLAFVPKDLRQLQTTDMELFVINDSNYYMQFAIYSGEKQMTLRRTDVVEPQTKLFLENITKEELNDIANMRFQAIAYKKIAFEPKPAVDMPLHVNPVKFYKLHSFAENDFFDEKAMLITIIENDVTNLGVQIDPVSLQRALTTKEVPQGKRQSKPSNVKPETIEVDLHIDQLTDTTAGMSRADMLQLQLDTFERVMKENVKRRGQKIVFIHGKGEGILRAEIEKRLKRKFPQCVYADASFQQYGFGATQVTVK